MVITRTVFVEIADIVVTVAVGRTSDTLDIRFFDVTVGVVVDELDE